MNLEESTTMTLRDLYYLLKNLFPSQDSCAHTVNQASMLLGVTRASLRILGCSRGVVKGALEYFYEGNWLTQELENIVLYVRYVLSGKWESTGAGVSIPQVSQLCSQRLLVQLIYSRHARPKHAFELPRARNLPHSFWLLKNTQYFTASLLQNSTYATTAWSSPARGFQISLHELFWNSFLRSSPFRYMESVTLIPSE